MLPKANHILIPPSKVNELYCISLTDRKAAQDFVETRVAGLLTVLPCAPRFQTGRAWSRSLRGTPCSSPGTAPGTGTWRARTFQNAARGSTRQVSRQFERRRGVGDRAKLKRRLHDGAEVEGLEEPEVGGLREAGAVDAFVDHGEVERRHERRLVARRRRRERRGRGADPSGRLLVLPQVQAAHLHGLLPLLRLQHPLLGHDLQLHGLARAGGKGTVKPRRSRAGGWFLCERCGRIGNGQLFIGEKPKKK